MIIVRLSGGLGNQMFQYAAGRRLAFRHDAVLKLDLSRLDHADPADTPREYELGCFAITAEMATPEECELCRRLIKKDRTPLNRFLKRFRLLPTANGLRFYRERGLSFDRDVLGLPDNICLDGYWQSEKYFADMREALLQEFTVRYEPSAMNVRLAEEIAACNSVSLHIRRGDYLTNPAATEYHGVCGIDYYACAIERMAGIVPAPRLFVFSDDPEWAASNLGSNVPVSFVRHNGPGRGYEDLRLMSLCRHNIIANSSFSWWGAWLNGNPGKIVIAPEKWFKDTRIDTKDLIPPGWIRL